MVTSELGACEWFVWDLRRSNLLDRGQLDQIVGEFLQKNPRAEPPALAEFLVGQGILTEFQSERLLQGKTQGFVLGPFVLMDALGAGSMGTVYKAQSKTDSTWFAVKVLPRRSMWNVRLARRKVRAFELCRHPAVVPFVDVGTSGGMHYLAWPFVEGETLDKFVAGKGRLPIGMAAHFALQIAEGLDVCHRQDLIHGLLKPSNLMVAPEQDQVHILDFGVGCLLAETEGESLVDTMSTANAVASGLDCSSPESIMEPTNLTPLGDQYSLGCTLYFMLAGQFPFPDGTAAEKMMAHQFKQPTPLGELNPDVPSGLVTVVNRLMSKSPEQRYATAADVVDALKPFAQAGSVIDVRPKVAPIKDTGMRVPNSGTHAGGRPASVPPSVSAPTPGPTPSPRGDGNGTNHQPILRPTTPLPRPQQPQGRPNVSARPQSNGTRSARPVTMQALATPKRGPAMQPVPQKAAPDLEPASEVDAAPALATAPVDDRRFDEKIGPAGAAMLSALICCVLFLVARFFRLM
jgi:serine/threonine-protein kinase